MDGAGNAASTEEKGEQVTTMKKDAAFKRYTKRILAKGDAEEADAWLLTYPLFSSSSSPNRQLFGLWEKRYGDVAARQEVTEDQRAAKISRLNAFAAAWCRSHSGDLSSRQMGTILQWAMKHDQPLANEIKLLLLRNRPTAGAKEADSQQPSEQEATSTTPRQSKRVIDFMEIPEPVLARELTIIEWQLFQDVNVRSLLSTKNQQPGGDSLFEPIITQYKLVSHWVATEILVTKSTTMQVQVLEKFIRLANQFLLLNNFNSFMEIVSGLNHNSVQRLKGLWERISDKAREQWSEMDVLMSPQHNFRHYRHELKKRKAPVLPYFGIYLRDFTFINDGNQQYQPDGSINDKYVHLLYERAQEVRNFQSVPYNLATAGRSPAVQNYLASLVTQVVYDEEELYALSLKAQPSLWIDPTKGDGAESDTDSKSESSATSQSMRGALASSTDGTSARPRAISDADTDRDVDSDSAFNHRTDASDMSERGDDEDDDESDISEFGESVDDKPPPLPELRISMSEADKSSLEEQLLHKAKSESKPEASPEQQRKREGSMSEIISEGRVKSMIKGFNSGRTSDSELPRSPSTLRISHARSSDGLQGNNKTLKEKKTKGEKKSKKEPVRSNTPMRRSATTPSISAPASPAADTPAVVVSPPVSVSLAAQAAVKVRQRRAVRAGNTNPNGAAVTGDSEEAAKPKCKTVRVPPAFDPLFYTAERIVHRYFSECYQSARSGTISIFDERYLMLRAPSLSVDFFTAIAETFAAGGVLLSPSHREVVAQRLLFDFAHAVGMSDARNFMRKMDLSFGPEGLSAGPVHFSYTGWAVVQLHDTCRPSPNDECYLYYDHPFSFESYSWNSQQGGLKKVPHHPVCVMNAGYSSGWTGESMGHVDLVAAEVMCTARGDSACRFVMAHPTKIQAHLDTFFDENNFSAEKRKSVIIHRFLASRKTFHYLNDAETDADGSGTPKTAKGEAKGDVKEQRKTDVVKSLINRWKGRSTSVAPVTTVAPAVPAVRKMTNAPAPSAEEIGKRAEIERVITTETKRSRKLMKDIFDNQVLDPRHGNVTVDGHRHLFIRGEAISYEFFHLLREMFPADQRADAELFASKFLFDFARSLGKTDQRFYTRKVLQESSGFEQKFLTLPALMSHTGWGVMKLYSKEANLDITSESDFFLKFAIHRSVEAHVWKKKEENASREAEAKSHGASTFEACGDLEHVHSPRADYTRSPVCIMCTGYITGFANECLRACEGKTTGKTKCESARPLKLAVVEVSCEALGHGSRCTFIMAPRDCIGQRAREYLERKKRAHFVPHLRLGIVQSSSSV